MRGSRPRPRGAALPAVDAGGSQIQGARPEQEDAWRIERLARDELLALVADGLGGHPAGDVASREAVKEFCAQFVRRHQRGTATPRQWLQDSTLAADGHLHELQRATREYRGMATTLVALYLRRSELWAVSVGDSYLLLLRKGQLVRLNELHAEGGGVTSCLGFSLTRLDLADALPVERGDRYLLASDGLATLEDEEVARLLRVADDAAAAARGLLDAVARRAPPNQDNATVVAVFA